MILPNSDTSKSSIFSGICLDSIAFHSHGGTRIAGWFISEKIPGKFWIITRGTPSFGNSQLLVLKTTGMAKLRVTTFEQLWDKRFTGITCYGLLTVISTNETAFMECLRPFLYIFI